MLTKILNDFLFGSSAPGGDFQSVLDNDMVPFEEDVQGFLRQTLEALDFIHERNIAHMDIKVGNRASKYFLTLKTKSLEMNSKNRKKNQSDLE